MKLSKSEVLEDVNFKELSKNCKTQEDLSLLTKSFMKNMIENILKSELEEELSVIEWFQDNWDKIEQLADFPPGMSSAVR